MSDDKEILTDKGYRIALEEFQRTQDEFQSQLDEQEKLTETMDELKEEIRNSGASREMAMRVNQLVGEEQGEIAVEHFTIIPSNNNSKMLYSALDEAMESNKYVMLGVIVAATIAAIYLIYKLVKFIASIIRETKSIGGKATTNAKEVMKKEDKLLKDENTEKAIIFTRNKFYQQFDIPADKRDPRFNRIHECYTGLLDHVFYENKDYVLKAISAATTNYTALTIKLQRIIIAVESLIELYDKTAPHYCPDLNFEDTIESIGDTLNHDSDEYHKSIRENALQAFDALTGYREEKPELTSSKMKRIETNMMMDGTFAFYEALESTNIMKINGDKFDGSELMDKALELIEREKKIAGEASKYPDAAKTRAQMSVGVVLLNDISKFYVELLNRIQKLQADYRTFFYEVDKIYAIRKRLADELVKRLKASGKDVDNQKLHHFANLVIKGDDEDGA